MEENNLIIPDIIFRELNGEASPKDMQLLQEWLSMSPDNQLLYENIRRKKYLASIITSYEGIDDVSAWQRLSRNISGNGRQVKLYVLSMLKYAAVIAIPVIMAAYLFIHKSPDTDVFSSLESLESLLQGVNETSLIGANGEIINLAAAGDSVISVDGATINRTNSEIFYQDTKESVDQKVRYNTLVSPRGNVFNLVLADGTKVWLNASSAIRYPVHFESNARKVYLTGEAFFEVKEMADRPFIVHTKNMNVEVLGTSFNLMAYPDDFIVEATLVTGQVKINTSKQELVLEPGTQARLSIESERLEEHQVNTLMYTSWKDDKYIFERTNLETVMTKLSRWYDYDIIYESDQVRNFHFSGTLTRYNDINKTLDIIELATDLSISTKNNHIYIDFGEQ